jgi:peptide/nickel transport system permease protein
MSRRFALVTAAGTATGVALLAALGPLLAPGSPTHPVGIPYDAPSSAHLLGTDALGRDVLARVLNGGYLVVGLAVAATVVATVLGIGIGVLTALASRRLGELIMRVLDLFAVVPALLLLIVLAAGFPGSDLALLAAVVMTTTPFSARVVRAAALQLTGRGFVEVALARGDGRWQVLRRDLLPNLAGPVLADAGLRFVGAVYLIATAGFLGIGRGAPSANWGRMVAENISGAALAVLPFLVPALLLVIFGVAVNLLADELVARFAGSPP